MTDIGALVSAVRICALTTLPKTTLRDYVKRGDFPRPLKLGPRRYAWRLTDVSEWINSRPVASPIQGCFDSLHASPINADSVGDAA